MCFKPEKVSIYTGDTLTITWDIYPVNSSDTIQWKVSNDKIATISNDGVVKAIAPGKATITAVCGKVSATCEITILESNIDVEFSDNKLTTKVESNNGQASIKLYSVFGQCVYKKSVNNGEEIDLSRLDDGTYILQVVSEEKNISKRIVKSTKK